MTQEELQILEDLPQFPTPKGTHGELHIGKNDPKNGGADYWWCTYGDIYLHGYYALPALLAELARECIRLGYATNENALVESLPNKEVGE